MKAIPHFPLLSDSSAAQTEFAYQLFDALFRVGVAYVPVLPAMQDNDLFNSLRDFFALSDLQKRSLAQQLSSPWQGVFLPLGQEQLSDENEDYKEVLDLNLENGTYAQWLQRWGKQSDADSSTIEEMLPHPEELARLTAQLYKIFHAFQEQANRVLAALEIVYQQPPNSLVKQHGQNSTLRLLHYPPAPHFTVGSVRLGAHQDYSGITLLWQDSTGGLEVLTPNYEWVAVDIPPGCIGVLASEVMQRWSGDTLHAAPHRVRITDAQQLQNTRYSIAFFCETNHDCVVYPGSLISEPSPADTPIVIQEFLDRKYDQIQNQAVSSVSPDKAVN
ncbi:isopenicillin N synthase family oxygenase [Trichocoleus sp. FACHB-591]|uniref:isopenicillin N synthase family oxygenase n=1 Tax=Trichocoleus sp. FACHB-591 TaxID=2692872 RepID=UPI0016833494|nr:isopenicillin N synthase family oxygenase [Trichocoleus sp. FACHB-591]MBD2096436.1 isopenicillin N synthase family oxygenase [Trichocoleus sp. FACHB-591]